MGSLDPEFPQGTGKSVFLETRIKLELMTLLTTSEAGYKTSNYQSVMSLGSFVEENQQNLGCYRAPEALMLQNIIFLLNYFAHLMQNMDF